MCFFNYFYNFVCFNCCFSYFLSLVKSCNVAILAPDEEELKRYAANHHIEGSMEELCQNEVNKYVFVSRLIPTSTRISRDRGKTWKGGVCFLYKSPEIWGILQRLPKKLRKGDLWFIRTCICFPNLQYPPREMGVGPLLYICGRAS